MSFVSYHVNGFRRDDHKANVSIIVDVDEKHYAMPEASPHAVAEKIAGPEYCFYSCFNINQPVPDGAKGRLFHSDEELYAAAPGLAPRTRRRAKR